MKYPKNSLNMSDDSWQFDSTIPGLKEAKAPMLCSWKVSEFTDDSLTELISEKEAKNIVVNTGRDEMIKLLLGFTGAASGTPFIALGVGASGTAATVTDTQLVHELIDGNPGRKNPLLDSSGGALDDADIEIENITLNGCEFEKKIVVQQTYGTGDALNGNIFQEFGLFTTADMPPTPGGVSGIMFNRFVDPDPITKTASNAVTVQITLRF